MIKKYGWAIIVIVLLFFVAGFYQKCQDERVQEAIDETKLVVEEMQGIIDMVEREKLDILTKYEAEIAKPPQTITEMQTKVVKITDPEAKKVAEEALLLAEFWKKENEKTTKAFMAYVEADKRGTQELMDCIYKLNIKIATLESLTIKKKSPFGFGLFGGVAFAPEYPDITYVVGVGVYYEINIYKLFKAIF